VTPVTRTRSPAAVEAVLLVLGNAGILALVAWLGLRGTLAPVFRDPLMIVDALGVAVAVGVALSWLRFAQVVRGKEAGWRLDQVERFAQMLPLLGLIGTTLSLMGAFASYGDAPAAAGNLTAKLLPEIGWALRNTVVGLAGLAWLEINAALAATAAEKIEGACFHGSLRDSGSKADDAFLVDPAGC
jgi:hypothetical protein